MGDSLQKGMDRELYRASKWGDVKLLDQVLKGHIDVFQEETFKGDTALHIAAFFGHTKLAMKLMQKTSENPEAGMQFLKAQNTDGNTALHVVAKGGCEEMVRLLVEKDSGLACVKNHAGETALFKASENGHVGIVEYLLNYTPESEELDRRNDGQTPLHGAVFELHTGVTEKLLEKRPTLVHKADAFQRTPLHILALVPLVNPLSLWRRSISYIIIPKIVRMLLKKDISLIYRVDANSQSALHLGAKVGCAPFVIAILRYQTDCTHILDKDGRTALHLAVENASHVYQRVGRNYLKTIISSLTLTELMDCSDKSGQTALDISIQKTHEDQQLFSAITNHLKRHGARQNMFGTVTIQDSLFREGSASSTRLKSNWRLDIVSINAVLIATVAFAAAFTMPGDIDSDASPPVPFLLNLSLFKLFVIFDSLAFCSSVGAAILLMYNQQEDPVITSICINGLWIALTCIAFTFGAAIHLVVARKCMWLAVVVWIMVCYIPIWVKLESLHMFTEQREHAVELIQMALVLTHSIFLRVVRPPLYLGAFLMGYLILPAWRMLIRVLSWTRQ